MRKPAVLVILLALGFVVTMSVTYAGVQDGMSRDKSTEVPANQLTVEPFQGNWRSKCLDFDNMAQGAYSSIGGHGLVVTNNSDDLEIGADNPGGRFTAPHTILPTFYGGEGNRNRVDVPAGTQAVQVTMGDYGYDADIYNLSCYNDLDANVGSVIMDVGDAPGGYNLRVTATGDQTITYCEFWSEGTNSNSAFFDNVCVAKEIE